MVFKKYIFLLFIALNAVSLNASGWYQVSGDYATVEYPQRLKSVADSLLRIADLSIPRICDMHDLPVESFEDDPAKIILTDAPDVPNGFAIGKTVVIYALSSGYLSNWTGFTGWYEQVLTHELVHHVTFRKLKRKLNVLGEFFNLSVPRWFYEGTAQYFSESWNLYRGDLYVKNAVLYGTLSYESLFNLNDGRLLYATAHAFTRYLAAEHGDSSLIDLLSYDSNGLFFDFDEAFRATYDKTPREMFAKFVRHMVLYYGNKMIEYPTTEVFESLPGIGYRTLQVLPMNGADSSYLYLSRLERNHLYLTALKIRIKNGETEILDNISSHIATPLVLSPDQRYVAFARPEYSIRDNINSIAFRWHVYDFERKSTKTIAKNLRAREAAFTPDNELIIAEVLADGSVLRKYSQDNDHVEDLFKTRMPVGQIVINSKSETLFEAQRPNGHRDLFLLQKTKLTALTNDALDERNVSFLSDTVIIFNRYEKNHPVISVMNLNKREIQPLLNDQYEYWLQSVHNSQNLIVASLSPGRTPMFSSAPIDSIRTQNSPSEMDIDSKGYDTWTTKKPISDLFSLNYQKTPLSPEKPVVFPQKSLTHLLSFGLPTYDEELGLGIYGITAWLEPLQRQTFSGTFMVFPENFDQSFIALSHSLRIANTDLFTTYYHGPVIFDNINSEYDELVRDYLSLGLYRKRYIQKNSRLPYSLSLFYTADQFDADTNVEHILYHGPDIGFSVGYRLPSLHYPAVPKRHINLSGNIFKSLSSDYDFTILSSSLKLGTQLLSEDLGIQTSLKYVHAAGDLPVVQAVGIDRFYQYNLPRDLRYTHSLRGIDKDIFGETLYWSSTELSYFISEKTPFNLIILPVQNLACSAFLDAARVDGLTQTDLYSYGGEVSFGNPITRFAAGYAESKIDGNADDKQYYLRLSIFLPEF